MKKLIRGEPPECLARFHWKDHDWRVISANHLTNDLWTELNKMQHGFCAYCECKLGDNNRYGRHIEHFRPQSKYPDLTFRWNNLFGSCNNGTRCGRYKDNEGLKGISIDGVIKPDDEHYDPSNYWVYQYNGTMDVRTNISDKDKMIAENTLKVFHLNDDTELVNLRKSAMRVEKKLCEEYFMLLADESATYLRELLKEVLAEAKERIKTKEFGSALLFIWGEL